MWVWLQSPVLAFFVHIKHSLLLPRCYALLVVFDEFLAWVQSQTSYVFTSCTQFCVHVEPKLQTTTHYPPSATNYVTRHILFIPCSTLSLQLLCPPDNSVRIYYLYTMLSVIRCTFVTLKSTKRFKSTNRFCLYAYRLVHSKNDV